MPSPFTKALEPVLGSSALKIARFPLGGGSRAISEVRCVVTYRATLDSTTCNSHHDRQAGGAVYYAGVHQSASQAPACEPTATLLGLTCDDLCRQHHEQWTSYGAPGFNAPHICPTVSWQVGQDLGLERLGVPNRSHSALTTLMLPDPASWYQRRLPRLALQVSGECKLRQRAPERKHQQARRENRQCQQRLCSGSANSHCSATHPAQQKWFVFQQQECPAPDACGGQHVAQQQWPAEVTPNQTAALS